jgi:hypothetical protein
VCADRGFAKYAYRYVFRLAAFLGGGCLGELRNLFWFSDDFDLRFPFGKMHWDVPVIPDILVQVYHFVIAFVLMGGIEATIMYRMRDELLPPSNRKWWSVSKQFGRGTLAAAALIWLSVEIIIVQWTVLMEIRVVEDRASAMEKYCNNRGCLQNMWTQQMFVPATIVAMIVSTRNGPEPWPRLTRDLPAAVCGKPPGQLAVCSCLS